MDPKIRKGTLENGFTYYIRKNTKPENRVEMRLVVNAGSILEDQDQLGLAHFTEHMAFNGTKNFEKNELVDYLQSIGVRFGADLNAYTGFEQTVYMLPIPTDKPEIIDQGFQVLEDWAHNVLFTGEEIDKERGVVVEEWRTSLGAQERIRKKIFPILLKESRYKDRFPIGDTAVLKNFEHDVIRRFYRDWYRPDLMGIVIVGDIDPDAMMEKVEAHFSGIQSPENPRERKEYAVPGYPETRIAIAQDKELPFTSAEVWYLHPKAKELTWGDYRHSLMRSLYDQMINQRLEELTQQADPPFLFAGSGYSSFLGDKDMYNAYAGVDEKAIMRGLKAVLVENQRVILHGFTEGELERAKKELLSSYEKAYNERDKSESAVYADEYIRNFLEEEPLPGIESEFDFIKAQLPGIGLEEMNQLAGQWITPDNRAVVITAPEKEGLALPTEAEVQQLLDEVAAMDIEPYEDKTVDAPLIEDLPEAGKVVAEKTLEAVDAVEWTLSNGAKVVLKPTDFKNDEIRLSAFSFGGTSLASDEDYWSAALASQIISEGGLRIFSSPDLQKLLAGKNVSVNAFVDDLSEGISASTTPKDLETMLQMVHLKFTAPRKDPASFQSLKSRLVSQFSNLMSSPQFYFQDQLQRVISQDNLRGRFPSAEDLEGLDLDVAMDFYQDRFADAGDFTFFLVGNFEPAAIRPLIEQYIGSLPATDREESFKDLGIRPPAGKVDKAVKKGTEPQSNVVIIYTGELEDDKDAYFIDAFGEVLANKLIESLREEKGGTYSPRASASTSKYPAPRYTLQMTFSCGPENVDSLTQAAVKELKAIQEQGVSKEDLNKVQEAQRRQLENNLKENSYWLNGLRQVYYRDLPIERLTEKVRLERIENLNSGAIQRVANKYFDAETFIRVALFPEDPDPNATSAAPEDISAAEVAARYVEQIGGKDAIDKISSIKSEATMNIMGMSMSVVTAKKLPNKLMVNVSTPQGDQKQVYDGEKFVVSGPMGTQEMPPQAAEAMKYQMAMVFETAYAALGVTAELQGVEEVNGEKAYKVQYALPNGMTNTRWYSVETGLMVKNKDMAQEMVITEYTEVDGVKFPKSMKVKVQGMDAEMTIDKIELNTELEDALFSVE